MIGLVHQLGALGVGSEHGVERLRLPVGASWAIWRAGAAGHLDLAVVRIDLTDDPLHQGRLAGPVAANQAHPRTRRDSGGRAVIVRPLAHRDSIDGLHGSAPANNLGEPKAVKVLGVPESLRSSAPLLPSPEETGDPRVS